MKTIIDYTTALKNYFAKKSTVTSQSLAANGTTVTFTGLPQSGNYLIDFYASDGSNYTAIDTSTAGTAVLIYEAVASARTIYCEVKGV